MKINIFGDFGEIIWKCRLMVCIFALMEKGMEYLKRFGKLSQIDLSIMQDVANDIDKAEIAVKSNLTKKQVYSKLESIKKKMGVKSLPGAAVLLFRNGLID